MHIPDDAHPIPEFPGYYVTRGGRIWSTKSNVWLSPGVGSGGYHMVALWRGGKSYTKRVHRLVAETLIPREDGMPVVNHKNGVKSDNSVSNLEWTTSSKNNLHAYRLKLKTPIVQSGPAHYMYGKFGADSPRAKPVVGIDPQTKHVVLELGAISEAPAELYDRSSITKCCRGKLKTHAGLVWSYR